MLHVIKLLNYKNPSDESERAATAEPKHLLTHSSIVFWLKNPGKITLHYLQYDFFLLSNFAKKKLLMIDENKTPINKKSAVEFGGNLMNEVFFSFFFCIFSDLYQIQNASDCWLC